MELTSVRIINFKSIDDSNEVTIDPLTTILVGQNESGKTGFLQALYKSNPVESNISYNVTEEYPRKGLNVYQREHANDPAVVCVLKYELTKSEIENINNDFGFNLLDTFSFSWSRKYNGSGTVDMNVNEKPYIEYKLKNGNLSSEVEATVKLSNSIPDLISKLEAVELKSDEMEFLQEIKGMFDKTPASWRNLTLAHYIWSEYISPKIPKFLYFDDYRLLPGKINLPELIRRVDANQNSNQVLSDEDKTALSLLEIAGVELVELTSTSGYENVKAKLEAISNSITDKVFEYWRQNQELDVEFDIREDPNDQAPFNNGNNLYIRIRNRRHRVTVPFSQRSKGFIWFFSFIIWFDCIKQQLQTDRDLILLLDEPGLSLHALAQNDFLRYIDNLAKDHQIIYSTHSPFMVPKENFNQVRMVEDKIKEGTKVTSNVSSSDPKTLFPLQAALGYSIAQNLFISKKNLLVEGPADLIYLKFFSSLFEASNRTYINPDITIVPVGGLDKIVSFVALLGGNQLMFAILHDYNKKPDARLESLVKEKLVTNKQVLNFAMYRDSQTITKSGSATPLFSSDIEDMLSPKLYMTLFNSAYRKELNGVELKEPDLPLGDRIVDRINKFLQVNAINLRPSGGFNHYLIASHLASKPLPISKIDAKTLSRFENIFTDINKLLDSD
ncbi:AAA family ATPase [Paenibacillus sp. WQ 127069]|uniref:AAA family ATPase n=1 Tax=Paenibacillus baimaensis TaxID=2982185 RepID=A0ABT2UB93_9BACL|nr:AAA family ATPase [Paenibacillus sp. WQ 127069]MCU6791911.1 AAA family ATPase [Paenibacillus sp. WQ 127069]